MLATRYVILATLFACGRGSSYPGAPASKAVALAVKPIALGASIGLVGDLEGLAFGTSMAAARAKVPGLAVPSHPRASDGKLAGTPPSPGAPRTDILSLATRNVRYRATFVDDRLTSVQMELEALTADEVWKAWGRPFDTGAQLVVVDRERRLRAVVDSSVTGPVHLKVEPMVPLAALIDPDPEKVAGVRVLGRPVRDVMRELEPRAVARTGTTTYRLAPTEYSYDGYTSLSLSASNAGLVEGWTLDGILFDPEGAGWQAVLDDLLDPSPAAWNAVLATYENAWGHDFDLAGGRHVFGHAPQHEVDWQTGSARVAAHLEPNQCGLGIP